MNEPRSPDVPVREGTVAIAGGNDAELDEPVEVVDRYPRPLRELLTRESAHNPPC
jgi:hypothetical protein